MNFLERTELMVGRENIEKIASKNILVIGLGGVGGSCCETLIRSGIKNITIVDSDYFDITNLNRQVMATIDTIGMKKTDGTEIRLKTISQDINIKKLFLDINENTISNINFKEYDYIVDAIDTITSKILIIEKAYKEDIKIISAMGAGNKLDPTKFKIDYIEKTHTDPIARILRKKLKEKNVKKIPVVFSTEIPISTNSRTPGSMSFVPPVCGMIITSHIIRDIFKS